MTIPDLRRHLVAVLAKAHPDDDDGIFMHLSGATFTVSRLREIAAAWDAAAAEGVAYRAKLSYIQDILSELIRDGDRSDVTMEAHAAASLALSDPPSPAYALLSHVAALEAVVASARLAVKDGIHLFDVRDRLAELDAVEKPT